MFPSWAPDTVARNLSIFIDRCDGMTLDAIAAKYGITRERVRQIVSRAKVLLAKRQQHERIIRDAGGRKPVLPARPANHPDFGAQSWTPEQQAREFGLIK